MDQIPMVEELIVAGKHFVEAIDKRFPIAVAFWLKDRDESDWSLHIASQEVDDANRRQAFEQIVRIISDMKDANLGLMDIKLREMNDRIVQFALEFQRSHPARLATVFNVPSFDGVEMEGMYLYPPLRAAAA